MIHVYSENDYGRPATKGLDTSPFCKELGVFNKYNCFSFDLHVSRLILESEGKKYDKTDQCLRVRRAIFLPRNKLLLESGTSFPGFRAATAILNS